MTQINHPDHYKSGGVEAIDVIEAFNLNFNLGNVIKYILRNGRKKREKPAVTLRKARWYLNREIKRLKSLNTLPVHQSKNNR